MFEVIVGLETMGTYASFNEACKRFFDEIFEVVQEGTSFQWLETTNFLVKVGEPLAFMGFYDARDFAIRNGLIVNGTSEFQEVPELSPEAIELAFSRSMTNLMADELDEMLSAIREILAALKDQV